MPSQLAGFDVTRHDVSLFTIGFVLLCGLAVPQFTSVARPLSLFIASIPAVLCAGYTLFYRPPE